MSAMNKPKPTVKKEKYCIEYLKEIEWLKNGKGEQNENYTNCLTNR